MIAGTFRSRGLLLGAAAINLLLITVSPSVGQTGVVPGDRPPEPKVVNSREIVNSGALDEANRTTSPDEKKDTVASPKTTQPEIENKKPVAAPVPAQCKRMITADVVAIPQPIMMNRLGAAIPGGMIFALRRDTVAQKGTQLRTDKRPRPIVLRANVGDCLTVNFENSIPQVNF